MRGEGEVEGSGVKVHAYTYMYCRRTYVYTHFILVMDPSAVESAPSTLRMMQINEGGYYLEEERGQHYLEEERGYIGGLWGSGALHSREYQLYTV